VFKNSANLIEAMGQL